MTATRTAAEKLVAVDAHEGPVWVEREDALYFTAVPRDGVVAIKRLDLVTLEVSVVREDANGANGMTLSADGSLLVCEQGSLTRHARISRVHLDADAHDTVVEDWQGLVFNSPNDVVEASDGSIWFTDPSYGFLQGFRPQPEVGDFVYRHDPATGRTTVVADSFDKPNGLAFSPDQRVLYVGDSGANQSVGSYHPDRPHHVVAFDVVEGRRLVSPRLFAVITPGFPDGLKVDGDGNVYVSSFSGVQVFSPDGEELGQIPVPGAVNFAFAGDRLLITNDSAVWSANLKGAF